MKKERVDKLHTNTRDSDEGVERKPGTEEPERGDQPATGLIGNGKGFDPRYVSQR